MRKFVLALLGSSLILMLAACGGESATQEPAATVAPTQAPALPTVIATATSAPNESGICAVGISPSYLSEVVLAKNTQGDNFTPDGAVEAFDPADKTFHAVATLVNAPENIKMRAIWYLVKAEGYKPNTKIDENEVAVDKGGSRNVDFTLKTTQESWPPGAYCVEIYAEGNLALSKNFSVTGSATPSNATTDVVKQVVLAQDTASSTFEPVNPTTTFKHDAPFIHAVLQIQDAPANTLFRARWYPPRLEPLNFELTAGGSRWLDFRLTPAPDGFPTGEYKVEIYVNDQLGNTQSFTVE